MRKQIKLFMYAALALFIVSSCSSDKDDLGQGNGSTKNELTINLELEDYGSQSASNLSPFTRAGLEQINPNRISSVNIFVVKNGQVIFAPENVSLSSATNKLSVALAKEVRDLIYGEPVDIYVVANAKKDIEVKHIQTLEDLNDLVVTSSFNRNNPENFVMSGIVSQKVLDNDNRSINLNVKRAASKFNVDISFDKNLFTTNIHEATEKYYIEEASVKLMNFNNKTFLFPLEGRQPVLDGIVKSSNKFVLANSSTGDFSTKGISYQLPEELYSYINSWDNSTIDESGTYLEVTFMTSHKGKVEQNSFPIRFSIGNNPESNRIDANKSYTIRTFVNDVENPSDVNGDIDVEDWDPEDIVGDITSTNFIYIQNSKSSVTSEKDYTHSLKMTLGKNNQYNNLAIENLSVTSMDFYYDVKAAGALNITKKNKFNNAKLRRAKEYIYADYRTELAEEYVIAGTAETMPIVRVEARELDDVKVAIKGTGRNRIVEFTSKKPLNFLDKVIKFEIVDSKAGITKTVEVTHKDVYSLSTAYPFSSGILSLVPTPAWNNAKQTIRQLIPGVYDFAEKLIYGEKEDDEYDRWGALIINVNTTDLKYAYVGVPEQEMKKMSFPVIFTGFDFASLIDPLKWLTYDQKVVTQTQKNAATISPNFMIASRSAILAYKNIQQAQAYCHSYWEVVKDPYTGAMQRFTNFRLPTPAELQLIVDLEKDGNLGMRTILDNCLGLHLFGVHASKEQHYWSSQGLVELDRDGKQGVLHNVKEMFHRLVQIAKVRCVRNVPKATV